MYMQGVLHATSLSLPHYFSIIAEKSENTFSVQYHICRVYLIAPRWKREKKSPLFIVQ